MRMSGNKLLGRWEMLQVKENEEMREVGKERKEIRGTFLEMRGTIKQINLYKEEKRRQRRVRRRIE